MISPNRPFTLLPQDREIMALTGMGEVEYRKFVHECQAHSRLRPGQPVALTGFTLFAVNLAIGLLLTSAAYLLTPKPKTDNERPEVEDSTVEGQDVVRRDRFTAKSGFDSVQNVVDLGSIVPIIYANRGESYGGVRINTNLLWSQMLSVGGGQFFKGLFLVGEGSNKLKLDLQQTALGNNTLASYDLEPNVEAGRITIYATKQGGRIQRKDYQVGVVAKNDIGAESNDIYSFNGSSDFCEVVLPSNQTEFGVYSILGNNLGYKVGEDWKPLSTWQNRSDGDFEKEKDNNAIVERVNNSITWTTRAGFLLEENGEFPQDSVLKSVSKGELLTYKIFRSFQAVTFYGNYSTAGDAAEGIKKNTDIRTAIPGKQRTFDELINVGDVFKAGSATVICVSRSAEPFISNVEVDGEGSSVEAKFQVLEAGKVHLWSEFILATEKGTDDYGTTAINEAPKGLKERGVDGVLVSASSHAFRMAVAAFSVERPCHTVEVGIRSNLQLKSSGIANFNSLEKEGSGYDETGFGVPDTSYQAYVDSVFCGGYDYGDAESEANPARKTVVAGTYTASDTRYSFFRVLIREIGQKDFTALTDLYGTRSATGVDVYNYIRFRFSNSVRREFRFVPITSWEIRSEEASGDLYVLDPHVSSTFSIVDGKITIEGNGEKVKREQATFGVKAFEAPDGQLGMAVIDDLENENYVDGWARLSEEFIYDEVSTSAQNGPENSISYINLITSNDERPEYDNLAMVGVNVQSTRELRNLNQLSVYVTSGVIESSLFPDVLEDLLINERYGVGGVFSKDQIDRNSFQESAEWTSQLGYAFDGAISSRINIRTWGSERAQDFLLNLSVSSGRFTLKPAIRFWEPEPIAALFTSGNIIEDSFTLSYLPIQERTDPIVSVKWREERAQGVGEGRGLFPVIREFTTRMRDVPDTAPVIQLDLSNFCTSIRQAADRGYYECLKRRFITHAVQFKTTPAEATLEAGSVIKLGIETIDYQQPLNGAITQDGLVTSWPVLSNGTHDVLVWDGKDLNETRLKVRNGKTNQFRGCAFCLRNTRQTSETYKVQSVTFDDDGNIDVVATNWPTDEKGVSVVSKEFTDNNFEVTGISPSDLPPFVGPPVPTPEPTPTPGPLPDPFPEPTPTPVPGPTPEPNPTPWFPPDDIIFVDDPPPEGVPDWTPGPPPNVADVVKVYYYFGSRGTRKERTKCNQCFDGDEQGTTYPDVYQYTANEWVTDYLGPSLQFATAADAIKTFKWKQNKSETWNIVCPRDFEGSTLRSYEQARITPIGDIFDGATDRTWDFEKGKSQPSGFYPQCDNSRVINQWNVISGIVYEYKDGSKLEKYWSYQDNTRSVEFESDECEECKPDPDLI